MLHGCQGHGVRMCLRCGRGGTQDLLLLLKCGLYSRGGAQGRRSNDLLLHVAGGHATTTTTTTAPSCSILLLLLLLLQIAHAPMLLLLLLHRVARPPATAAPCRCSSRHRPQ